MSEYPHSAASEQYDSDSENSSVDEPLVKPKQKSRRPGTSDFRQQRLAAFNPVLTAKTVIPLLIAIAVVFAPLGAAMWYASHRVQDIMIDYSQCENMALSDHWSEIPGNYTFHFRDNIVPHTPVWRLTTDESQPFEDERRVCQIQFHVPVRMKAPLYLFYRLKDFYANHRRYVKSFSEDQITGKAASVSDIKNTIGQNCEPLSVDENGKRYYPCGLIANSLFNDTYSLTFTAVNGTENDYSMTDKGIAWSTEDQRYKKTKYHWSEIAPPPNWYKKFPNGYNSTNVPDISHWEQFQVWMKPSALPDFSKLALRNDHDALEPGTYQIDIGLHFPVLPFNGHKYVYISQRSAIGGKNIFLGVSWMVGGGICFVLAIVLLVVNFVKPRKTGDVNLLSWNREAFKKDEKETEQE